MLNLSITVLLGLSVSACAGGRVAAATPLAGGTSSIDSFRVSMPQLGNRERMIRVYLPPGYATSAQAFPVLYLQDAQQIFQPGWFGDWRVDETIDSLVAAKRTKGLIVVGIDNSAQRWDEYSPWVNSDMRRWIDSSWAKPTQGGEGKAYVDFLANTLKPEIDKRYRTLADREHTGVGGSSMGGLISLYAGVSRPDIFSRVMAMSSAVWFAEDGGAWLSRNRMLGEISARAAAATLPHDVRFYLDAGTAERSREIDPDVRDAAGERLTYPRAYLEGTQAVARALVSGGVPDSNVKVVIGEGGTHNEKSWASRLPGALLWLYR